MIYAVILIGIMILGFLMSSFSAKLLFSYFERIDKIEASCNLTAFELLVFYIQNLKLDIKVGKYSNFLDNSYQIKKKLILLSNDIFDNNSVGALAISMHELGHAMQHKNKGGLFEFYYSLTVLNRITSILLVPMLIFLIVSVFLPILYFRIALILLVVFYFLNLLARIIIIPLEKDASKIAIQLLKDYDIFNQSELKMAERLLKYAAFTYVGGFFNNYIKFFKKLLKGF